MMRGVHDKARVHFSIFMMGAAAFGMAVNAFIAKRLVKQGESLEKQFQEQQAEYNRKFAK